MPFVLLTLEFIQPSPAMPSPANSIRNVTARGLDEKEKAIFGSKHTIHMRQAFTNTHNKGTPLEDMMKDIPAMLNTLETLGYKVVSTTSSSIFKMRDLPDPVIRDSYIWTLSKSLPEPEPTSTTTTTTTKENGNEAESQ